MNYSSFYIIYPDGDNSKISIVEFFESCAYKISDYPVVSRQVFHDEESAVSYGKELAHSNKKNFGYKRSAIGVTFNKLISYKCY